MSRSLNGTSDYIDLVSAISALNASEGTLAGWVQQSSSTGIRSIAAWRINGDNELGITEFNGTYGLGVGASYNAGAVYKSVNTTTMTISTWYHLGLSWSVAADEFKFYVNGSQAGSTQTGLGTMTGSPSIFYLGNSAFSEFFAGLLAEFGLWSAPLTAGEFASLGKGFAPHCVRPQSLIEFWPLIGRRSPEPGFRNGYTGALTGTSAGAHPRIIYPQAMQTRRRSAVVAANGARLVNGRLLNGGTLIGGRLVA